MTNEQAGTGPSRAIGDGLEEPICGVRPQDSIVIDTIVVIVPVSIVE
jgi:hypothetical protein